MAAATAPPVGGPIQRDRRPPSTRGVHPRRRMLLTGGTVAGIYLAVSVGVWWQVWTGHPTSELTCGCGDPSLFAWSFGWVAHALGHGHNPLLSTAMFHPDGINLLANTSAFLEAFLLAPVTWVFGPVAALNVANTLAPALSALATYWAVRRILQTGVLGALVAGLVVELSPAIVSSAALSHLQISMLAFVPIIFVCLHELLVRQQRPPWRWGAVLAAAVVGQFFAGTEMLVIVALFAGTAVVVAGAVLTIASLHGSPTAGARAVHAARGLAVATVGAGAVLAYPAWFALAGPRHIVGEPWPQLLRFAGTRAVGFVTPQPTAGAEPLLHLAGYLGPVGQSGDYLGLGAVLVAVAAVLLLWRRPVAWALAAVALMAVWLSLGSVWVSPGSVRPFWVPFLPWATLQRLPILGNVSAQNFPVVTLLAVAGLVGLVVDRVARTGRGLLRVVAVAAAVGISAAVLVPLATTWALPLTVTSVDRPAWFVRDAPRLPAHSVVLAYPFVGLPGQGEAAVWQAMGGMHVDIAGGFGLVPGPDGHVDHGTTPGSATAILAALSRDAYGPPPPALDDAAALGAVRRAVTRWGVTTVVVTDRGRDPAYATRWFTAMLGRPPVVEDGASVWSLSSPARPTRMS